MKLKRFFPPLFLTLFTLFICKAKTRPSPYMVVSDEVLKLDNGKAKKGAYRSVRDFITIKASFLKGNKEDILHTKNINKQTRIQDND